MVGWESELVELEGVVSTIVQLMSAVKLKRYDVAGVRLDARRLRYMLSTIRNRHKRDLLRAISKLPTLRRSKSKSYLSFVLASLYIRQLSTFIPVTRSRIMAASRLLARSLSTASRASPPSLMSLADLTVPEIAKLLSTAHTIKSKAKEVQIPALGGGQSITDRKILDGRTVALLFSKRSTRTRVASESATALLGMSS